MVTVLTERARDRQNQDMGCNGNEKLLVATETKEAMIKVVGRNCSGVRTEGWRTASYSKRTGVSSPALG